MVNSRWMLSSMALGSLVLALVLPAGDASGQELLVDYSGELIDEDARPLAGVFALGFELHRDQESDEPIWREQHFVAVIDGQYSVQLGRDVPLNPELADLQLWVAVAFLDQEILRESLDMSSIVQEPPFGDPFAMAGTDSAGGGHAEVTFAQLADRALFAEEADRARDCETLMGRTIEDIDRTDEVIDRLADHQSDPNAHGSGGATGLGSSTTVLQRVGGDGGSRYTRMCPTGYVVVGIRGGAGAMVDSLELVCAPIQ